MLTGGEVSALVVAVIALSLATKVPRTEPVVIGYIRDATMLFLASLHSSVDRAVGFYPIGRGFESFWGRVFYPRLELVFYEFRRGFTLSNYPR